MFLVIGVDCMDWATVNKNVAYMPNLAKLIPISQHGILKSFNCGDVPFTPPCWTTIYTGVMPHVHGIEADGWEGNEHWLSTAYSGRKVESIFDQLSNFGVMTMPITFPAFEGPDWMVSGFGAPALGAESIHPTGLVSRHLMEGFCTDFDDNTILYDWKSAGDAKRCLKRNRDDLYQTEVRKIMVAERLNNEVPVETMFIGFSFIDKLHHQFYSSDQEIHHGYKFLDYLFGLLFNAFSPEGVAICCDHGAGQGITKGHGLDGFYLITGGNELRQLDMNILYFACELSDRLNIDNSWIGHPRESKHEEADIKNQLERMGYI